LTDEGLAPAVTLPEPLCRRSPGSPGKTAHRSSVRASTPMKIMTLGFFALAGRRSPAPLIALVLGAVFVAAPYSTWSELLLYDVAALLMFVMALTGWRSSTGRDRRFPACVTLAIGAFLLGELVWWAFLSLGLDPYPSIADGAFLSGYVPLAAAAAVLVADGQSHRDRSSWLDAGILTAVAGLVVWRVLMEPHVGDPSVSGLYTAVTLAYPLADLVVLGSMLVFLFSSALRDRRSMLFSCGVVATMTGDLVFAYQDLHGTFVDGSWVTFAWILGYVLIGTAAVTPPDRARFARDDVSIGRGRLVCTLLAVVVPQAVIAMELTDSHESGHGSVGVALGVSVVTLVLVSLRMWGLLGRARAVEQRRGADRLSTVIHHSADAVLLVDDSFHVSFASPAVANLTGVDPDVCSGLVVTSWFADDADDFARQLEQLALMPIGAVIPVEGRFASSDGSMRFVEGTACNLLDDGTIDSIVITLRDVSVRRELEEQLERRAFHDGLTGLANRALFVDRLRHALARTTRSADRGLAVVFIDLDDFKAVNDGMGHAVGDELLQKVADRLRACLRRGDTIARFGGDEFAILLEDVTCPVHARELAESVIEILRLPMDVGDLYLAVPASVGVAFAVADSTNESLMRDADIAMYSAKAQGKYRVVVFDDKLRDRARERLSMKMQLPQALVAGEFHLCYQPIYDIGAEQTLNGFETLIRWNHPSRGAVAPLDFVPLAEDTGDIIDIGRWVLEEACQQAAAWNERVGSPLTMSVNVSAVQLHHAGFLADVRRILESTGLPGRLLILEITESVLMEHQTVEGILDDLRALEVGIAIDDFGTGYSSLSYLRQFPVTSLKIDRSFVADLAATRYPGLVRSIISIADALGLGTVAEGVETADQLDLLVAADCHVAQGFFLGEPQPSGEIDALLRAVRHAPHRQIDDRLVKTSTG
jgi:diguanylate cyclase (GGDEF)-like protein/PAS domain S-box-containing protein